MDQPDTVNKKKHKKQKISIFLYFYLRTEISFNPIQDGLFGGLINHVTYHLILAKSSIFLTRNQQLLPYKEEYI